MQVADRREKIALLSAAFGTVKPGADGLNVATYCPACLRKGKQKLKLAVKLDDGKYHCWVCGIKGKSICTMFARYARSQLGKAYRLWPQAKHDVSSFEVPEKEKVSLPQDFQLFAQNLSSKSRIIKDCLTYLRQRDVSDDDLWRWRLGFSFEKGFVNRIIVPSFDAQGDINFYTTRAVFDNMWPRYQNAECKKQSIVFNELDIDWTHELVVTEGPFDTFKCRRNVTCIFGNTLDEHFMLTHRLLEHNTPVVLALDEKENVKTDKIAKFLYGYDIDVRIMNVKGDMGSMSKKAVDDAIDDARQWTPMSNLHAKIARIGA